MYQCVNITNFVKIQASKTTCQIYSIPDKAKCIFSARRNWCIQNLFKLHLSRPSKLLSFSYISAPYMAHCFKFKPSRTTLATHFKNILFSNFTVLPIGTHALIYCAAATYLYIIFYCIYNCLYACKCIFPFQWYPTLICSSLFYFKLFILLHIWLHLHGYC